MLFGGLAGAPQNDSFTFDGDIRQWSICVGTDGETLCDGLPDEVPDRARHRMEWSPAENALVLFGGDWSDVFYNDLFRLPANSDWEGPAPVTGVKPEGRCCVAFAYDTFNDHMFMAGGGHLVDTALPNAFTWIAPRWRCISMAPCDPEGP